MIKYSAGILMYRYGEGSLEARPTDGFYRHPSVFRGKKPMQDSLPMGERFSNGFLEVLLVHPGGPYWAKKDLGAWSIPKGLYDIETESPLDAAKREFAEETGFPLEDSTTVFIPLDSLKLVSGKIIRAWAVEGNLDAARVKSNLFTMEWPPHSGKQQEFPEVDRAGWFDIETAKVKILKGQVGFIEKLLEALARDR